MNKNDFYKLNINQTIYHNGQTKKIKALVLGWLDDPIISFENEEITSNWSDICKDCSLELPERYKRYENLSLAKNGKLLKGEFLAQLNNHLEYNDELKDLITDIVDGKVEL